MVTHKVKRMLQSNIDYFFSINHNNHLSINWFDMRLTPTHKLQTFQNKGKVSNFMWFCNIQISIAPNDVCSIACFETSEKTAKRKDLMKASDHENIGETRSIDLMQLASKLDTSKSFTSDSKPWTLQFPVSSNSFSILFVLLVTLLNLSISSVVNFSCSWSDNKNGPCFTVWRLYNHWCHLLTRQGKKTLFFSETKSWCTRKKLWSSLKHCPNNSDLECIKKVGWNLVKKKSWNESVLKFFSNEFFHKVSLRRNQKRVWGNLRFKSNSTGKQTLNRS